MRYSKFHKFLLVGIQCFITVPWDTKGYNGASARPERRFSFLTVRQQVRATLPVKHIIQSQARPKSFSQLGTRIHMMSHQGAQKPRHSTIRHSTGAGQYMNDL